MAMWGVKVELILSYLINFGAHLKKPPLSVLVQSPGSSSQPDERIDHRSHIADEMADADEDGMLRASSSTDPAASLDIDISDETQDFRFLSNIAL